MPNLPSQPEISPQQAADTAYKNGKWLEWYSQGLDREPTDTEKVLLGGRFVDAALSDEGYDGTVIAKGDDVFKGRDGGGRSNMAAALSFLDGSNRTEADKRMGRLHARQEFHTSPVVREAPRLLSNEPMLEFDASPENLIWTVGPYNELFRKMIEEQGQDNLSDTITEELPFGARVDLYGFGMNRAEISLDIPEGHRLIIDGIPKGSKYDSFPYTDENLLPLMQLQVYHNSEGYLMADKVFADGIAKKHDVSIKPASAEGVNTLTVDEDAPTQRAMDSLSVYNDRKQYVNSIFGEAPDTVQLMTTTSTQKVSEYGYDNCEITVTSPDDAGSRINIGFSNTYMLAQNPDVATRLYLVPDTSTKIAHNIYQ